ncbi:PAS domain S-box protein [Pseudochryseolinea flava]|uniref:Chemotaxis protein n=1 Tax=Pseudochryseolinea flava TaxID=2059302 RepID=A0A364Y2U9_9BACT|nr:PAS domain S-box protein [Pseudochryseolinea flava]RAW01012.1 hypothetical protein DQQ10_12325 [Pseudochryseolinea flava]
METKTLTSLFERIGGKEALNAAVDIFYKKVLEDPRINSFFQATDMKRQRTKLKSFLAMALGAPVKYTGKDLESAHAPLVAKGLNEDHFIIVAQHLEATLNELNVPLPLSAEVMAIAAGTKNHVLGIKNPQAMTKNYYQEKGNGSNAGSSGHSVEDLLKRITELEQQQRKNEQALEQALDAVITINSDRIVTFFNMAAEELFGFTREEVLGQNVKMIVPMEHRGRHDNYVDSNIRTGVNKVVGAARELEMVRKDGSKFWGNLSLSKCEVDGDTQYTAFIKDISEDRANKQRMYQTLEQAVDSVVTINADKKILFFNKAAEKMFGFTREEVMGQNVKMIVPFEHRGGHDGYVDANMKTSVNKVVGQGRDLEMTRRDGSKFWGNLSLSKVEINNEIQYTAFIKDISEERFQRERINQTLEQAVDSVVTIDDNKLITFFNKAAERMFGFSREEVLGKNIKMIVPLEHRANHDNYVESNMKTGVNKVVGKGRDLEMTTKDGQRFWGNLSLSRVLVDGKLQYTAFIKDITITKHNEMGFQEVIKAIGEIANGSFDFNIKLDGLNVDESVKLVTQDLINLRDNLKSILGEVNEVVRQAGSEGKLDARLRLTNTKGAWKELVDSINELLQSIAEPVMEFNKIVTEMANGDLTQRFQMAASGDIKNMASSLNKAVDNLNELLYNIGKNADIVASSSMNMLQKTEGMKRNTNEVASAISQMAKGAQDQAGRTDESSKLVEKVMASSNDMEKKANLINKAAEKGQKSSENGLKIMKTLVTNMSGIKESAGQTSKSIDILTGRAEEIGRTLNVITDIASQTNLLALNAAIEAARAGDAGRGFAVVAEEIRKLAEDSRKSAVEIEKIISDVQKDTQAATKAIETMQTSVKDGNAATNEAQDIFQEIAQSSDETFSFSKEIQEATSGQRVSIDLVVKNIEQIVVVAEETAAGTQQAASASQQLNNSMSEITDGSNKLSGVATELQTGVNKFKLRKAS